MNLYVCMQTHSTCYRGTKKMNIKGILWHSTGVNNPNLKRYVQPYEGEPNYNADIAKLGLNTNHNDWNHIKRNAGLNAWIGKFADGSVGVVQTMPWNFRPWGCGGGKKGSCNDGWIQFEICEDNLKDKDYAQKVWNEAVEFSAYLCKLYNLNPLEQTDCGSAIVPVITCHNDAYKLGVGCGHSDINHWFPKILGKNMENARKEIAERMGCVIPITPNQPQNNTNNNSLEEYKMPLIKRGSKGEAVMIWQVIVGMRGKDIDGDFGPATEAATRKFQKEHGLDVDGIVGKYSWSAGLGSV